MTGNDILQAFLFHNIIPVSEKRNGKAIVLLKGVSSDQMITVFKTHGARYDAALKDWYIERNKQKLLMLVRAISHQSGYQISGEKACKELERMILLKGYSKATVKNYGYAFQQFRDFFADQDLQHLTVKEIEDYLLYLRIKRNQSETAIHTAANAIKFYYEKVLGRNQQDYALVRPKKPQQLPSVFSLTEVHSIIKAIGNLKHKSMIMIAYACLLYTSPSPRD